MQKKKNNSITISDVKIEENVRDTEWVQLKKIHFKRDGKEVSWEVIDTHNYVAVVIFNKSKNKIILVKQFRPAVYYRFWKATPEKKKKELDPQKAFTYELCAGLIDKENKTPEEICVMEIEEECGYVVKKENLQKITTCFDVGLSGKKGIIYYIEVTDDNFDESKGGGLNEENEFIELYELDATKDSIEHFISDESKIKTVSTSMGLLWFLKNKFQKK